MNNTIPAVDKAVQLLLSLAEGEKTQAELGLRKQAHKKAPKMKDIVDDAQVDMADLFAPSKSAGHSKIR